MQDPMTRTDQQEKARLLTLNKLGLAGLLKTFSELDSDSRVIFLTFFTKRKAPGFAPAAFISYFNGATIHLLDFSTVTNALDEKGDDGQLTLRKVFASEEFEKVLVNYEDLRVMLKIVKKPVANVVVLRHEDHVSSQHGEIRLNGSMRASRIEETVGLCHDFDAVVRYQQQNLGRRVTRAMSDDAKGALRRHLSTNGLCQACWLGKSEAEQFSIKERCHQAQDILLGYRHSMPQANHQTNEEDSEAERRRMAYISGNSRPAYTSPSTTGMSGSSRRAPVPSFSPHMQRSVSSTGRSVDHHKENGDGLSARDRFWQSGRNSQLAQTEQDFDNFEAEVPDDAINPQQEYRYDRQAQGDLYRTEFDDHPHAHVDRKNNEELFDVESNLTSPTKLRQRKYNDRFGDDFVDNQMQGPDNSYYGRQNERFTRANGFRSPSVGTNNSRPLDDGSSPVDQTPDSRLLRVGTRASPKPSPRADLLIDLDRSTPYSSASQRAPAVSSDLQELITGPNGFETLDLTRGLVPGRETVAATAPEDEIRSDRQSHANQSRVPSNTSNRGSRAGTPRITVDRPEPNTFLPQSQTSSRNTSSNPKPTAGEPFKSSAFDVVLTSKDVEHPDDPMYDVKVRNLESAEHMFSEIEGLKLHFQVKAKQPLTLAINMDGEGGFVFRVRKVDT